MKEVSRERLMNYLCVDIGFTIFRTDLDELLLDPQSGDATYLTKALLRCDGLDPDLVDRRLYRQIRQRVRKALDEE
jgi:hypothetical protein